MQLYGKTALITGAARRIGKEIALTLARAGAAIVIHYHHSAKEAVLLKKQVEALRREAYLVRADFSHSRKPLLPVIKKMVREVYEQAPSVDILVNNASIFYPTPFGKISENDWDQFLTANLKAPFLLSQEIGLRMLKRKFGKIIHLADGVSERPHPKYLPYAISKAGLVAAAKGLAKALAPYVQVGCIAPGPILPAKGSTPSGNKKVVERTLLKRFGSPSDIAEAVRFFAEGTDFVTGSIIYVDGGASLA